MSAAAQAAAELSPDEALLFALLGLAMCLGCAWLWWRQLRRGRLMAGTPTSKIRSAAQGYVELKGNGHWLPEDRILAPLTQTRCVWWEYRIEELRQQHGHSSSRTAWSTIASARSQELFALQDATGEVVVDPCGAKIYPNRRHCWRGPSPRPPRGLPQGGLGQTSGRYRYTERCLTLGSDLYALGWLRSETAEAQDFDRRAEVAEWLRQLKADQRRLLREYDANRDGHIDAEEWEAARQQAIAEVDRVLLERSLAPGVHVLERPPDGRDYVLSGRRESELRRSLQWRAAALLPLALAAGVGTLWLARLRGWL